MTFEILLSIVISILGADGEEMEVDVIFINGSVYSKCLDVTACYRNDNVIFLNAENSYKRDICDRNPLFHELAHFKYPDLDIHTDCKLNAKVAQWKNTA